VLLYYYLHQNELKAWRRNMASLCQERMDAFQYFVDFSTDFVRSTAAFGTAGQAMLLRNVMPTAADYGSFLQVDPPSEWIDQMLFFPRILAADRAHWEEVAGYPIWNAYGKTYPNGTHTPIGYLATYYPSAHTRLPGRQTCRRQNRHVCTWFLIMFAWCFAGVVLCVSLCMFAFRSSSCVPSVFSTSTLTLLRFSSAPWVRTRRTKQR